MGGQHELSRRELAALPRIRPLRIFSSDHLVSRFFACVALLMAPLGGLDRARVSDRKRASGACIHALHKRGGWPPCCTTVHACSSRIYTPRHEIRDRASSSCDSAWPAWAVRPRCRSRFRPRSWTKRCAAFARRAGLRGRTAAAGVTLRGAVVGRNRSFGVVATHPSIEHQRLMQRST